MQHGSVQTSISDPHHEMTARPSSHSQSHVQPHLQSHAYPAHPCVDDRSSQGSVTSTSNTLPTTICNTSESTNFPPLTQHDLTPPSTVNSGISVNRAASTSTPNGSISPPLAREHQERRSHTPSADPNLNSNSALDLDLDLVNGGLHKSEDVSSQGTEVTVGTKRTASGQWKRSSIQSLSDLKPSINASPLTNTNGTHHVRTTSAVSSGSGVMQVCSFKTKVLSKRTDVSLQLSQELRTKLTYAMVKVQNGWQTKKLEDVESLASQSPRSTLSGFQHAGSEKFNLISPRTAMLNKSRRKWSDGQPITNDALLGLRDTANSNGNDKGVGNSNHNSSGSSGVMLNGRRVLAPPLDVVPSSSRRRPTPNGVPQNHQQNQHQHRSRPLSLSNPSPSHPNARPTSYQRTPSQNAAMEADAVETLLFMASPSNSGHHPPPYSPVESSMRSTQFHPSQTSNLGERGKGSASLRHESSNESNLTTRTTHVYIPSSSHSRGQVSPTKAPLSASATTVAFSPMSLVTSPNKKVAFSPPLPNGTASQTLSAMRTDLDRAALIERMLDGLDDVSESELEIVLSNIRQGERRRESGRGVEAV